MNGSSWLLALCFHVMVGGAIVVGGAVLASPVSAQQSSDEQARLHYQVAASYYEQADYESALREFQSAYRLSQRAQLFYNISLCYQQMDDLDEAISYLERYLNEVTEIENRPSLEQRLANLRTRRDQRQAQATTDTTTDTTTAVVTPPPRTGGDSTNIPAIVGFSIAGVGLIAGAIFTGLLFAEDSRVSSLPCGMSRTCSPSDVGSLDTFALVSDISWGVSLAGAIVGTVFLFVPTGSSASADTASLRISPVAGQVNGVMLSGAF